MSGNIKRRRRADMTEENVKVEPEEDVKLLAKFLKRPRKKKKEEVTRET